MKYEIIRDGSYRTETSYAIGTADHFGVVTDEEIIAIEYDLLQVKEEGYIEFLMCDGKDEKKAETSEFPIKQETVGSIGVRLGKWIEGTHREVKGFIAPDDLLPEFIMAFPDMRIFRE